MDFLHTNRFRLLFDVVVVLARYAILLVVVVSVFCRLACAWWFSGWLFGRYDDCSCFPFLAYTLKSVRGIGWRRHYLHWSKEISWWCAFNIRKFTLIDIFPFLFYLFMDHMFLIGNKSASCLLLKLKRRVLFAIG